MSGKRAREVSSPPKTPPSAYDRKSFWDAGFEAKKWAMQYRIKDHNGELHELSIKEMTALAHLGNFDIAGRPFYTRGQWEYTFVMVQDNGDSEKCDERMPLYDGATRFHIEGRQIYIYDGRNQKELVK